MLELRPDLNGGEEIELFFAALASFTSHLRHNPERRNHFGFAYSDLAEMPQYALAGRQQILPV